MKKKYNKIYYYVFVHQKIVMEIIINIILSQNNKKS